MHYFEVELFFGFPVNNDYDYFLKNVDLRVYELYVREGDAYLQNLTYQGIQYLGKPVSPIVEIATLELLQLNIYSLLKKLVPDFAYETIPLQIVPVVHMLDVDAKGIDQLPSQRQEK